MCDESHPHLTYLRLVIIPRPRIEEGPEDLPWIMASVVLEGATSYEWIEGDEVPSPKLSVLGASGHLKT